MEIVLYNILHCILPHGHHSIHMFKITVNKSALKHLLA